MPPKFNMCHFCCVPISRKGYLSLILNICLQLHASARSTYALVVKIITYHLLINNHAASLQDFLESMSKQSIRYDINRILCSVFSKNKSGPLGRRPKKRGKIQPLKLFKEAVNYPEEIPSGNVKQIRGMEKVAINARVEHVI